MDRKEKNPDMENQAVIDGKVTSAPNWLTKIKKIFDDVLQGKIFDVHQGPYLQMWNSIFVISCVFAVSLDPLLLYVVNVNQDEKCLHTDKKLKIVALVMRSLTDVIFFVHLICEILDSVQKTMEQTRGNSGKKWEARKLIQYAWKIAQNMSWLSIIIDILALVPLPQLIILMFYPTKDSGFVLHKMFVKVFLLGQYVPRLLRIHLSAKVFKKKHGKWANGIFNLFLYILAGHVLGAFWYFFSVQRQAACWYEACVKLSVACEDTFCIGCKDTLYCDSGNITARYIIINETCPFPLDTLDAGSTNERNIIGQLNESCPLGTKDDENTTTRNIIRHLNESCMLDTLDGASSPFNFGIFLDSLKNENPDQKFGKKFLYCFWWGLRNLSNFGTNLVTSTYVWENLFAILISVIGLLLFIYLIGNVQAFMQMGATKTEYMSQKRIKRKEAKKTLRKIPMIKDRDEKVLKMMCDHLKPATYNENSFVFRTGDPLDCMLLIIEGTMWTYTSSDSHAGQGISSMAIKSLGNGDFYGEELLDWASDCFTEVPVSSKHVKSQTKVEAFLLMAKDLETVLDHFNNREEVKEVALSTFCCFRTIERRLPTPSPAEIGDDNGEILRAGKVQTSMQMEATKTEDMRRQSVKTEERKTEEAIRDEEMRQQAAKIDDERRLCMKTLTKIPMLKDMDEKVLKMMCDYLKPATYIENSFVFRTGDPLDCMLFVIEGTMWTYASSESHAGQGISSMAMKPLRNGDFYGEELLNWASDCFTEVPVSSKHVKSRTKVEAFVLMAEDLETVVSQFRPPEEVEKVTLSAVLRFHTKAQRRPPPSLAEIGDENSETLPYAASN